MSVTRLPAGVARPRWRFGIATIGVEWSVDRFGPPGNDGYPVLQPTGNDRRACEERFVGAARTTLAQVVRNVAIRRG
jgi:hypothetical protein